MARILVVDDDRAVRDSLRRALELEGHEVVGAADGAAAFDTIARDCLDAVLLDVNLPDIDGFAVARRLRATGVGLPILMLTARAAVTDRVAGLDTGADDYLVKPFALEELLARLRAALRRGVGDDDAAPLRIADLVVDVARREVRRADRTIALTRTEFALLQVFAENPERVMTREVLHDRVWGHDMSASNSVEVYVGYLRRKLEAGGEPRLLHTVRGFGYVLRAEAGTP